MPHLLHTSQPCVKLIYWYERTSASRQPKSSALCPWQSSHSLYAASLVGAFWLEKRTSKQHTHTHTHTHAANLNRQTECSSQNSTSGLPQTIEMTPVAKTDAFTKAQQAECRKLNIRLRRVTITAARPDSSFFPTQGVILVARRGFGGRGLTFGLSNQFLISKFACNDCRTRRRLKLHIATISVPCCADSLTVTLRREPCLIDLCLIA